MSRATSRNPSVGEAAQAILRAEALLSEARSVFLPLAYGNAGTAVLDAARGFGGSIVQPKTQTAFSATASYSVLAASRWAAKNQAADRVGTARVAAQETRLQVAVSAAQAYLAVIAAERQLEIVVRNRDTAKALEDYARTRLEAGQGSRLNHVRSVQQRASAEGLVELAALLVRRGAGSPGRRGVRPGAPGRQGRARAVHGVHSGGRLLARSAAGRPAPHVRARGRRAHRLRRVEELAPERDGVLHPALRHARRSLRAVEVLAGVLLARGPDLRRHAPPAEAGLRSPTARRPGSGSTALENEARSELRIAQEAVKRTERIVAAIGQAAESAREALRITEIAYRAGATTNIEVVQAQQTARNAEIEAAVAEDRLRQARLDLLVALGQFP